MNFATFDLNLLRVFQALMRERSATRAGERVGLSQPAVSAALSRLRHALADTLFIRQGNEMVPTPRATALAGPVEDALAAMEAALGRVVGFDPATADRIFTLLGADFFSNLLMPGLHARIAAIAPGIRMQLLDSARGDIARTLQEGVTDIALEGPQETPDWVARHVLFLSPFAVVAARGEAALAGVAEGGEVPLDLFCALPHALRSIDGSFTGFTDTALAALGLRRRVVLALPHFHAVGLAVARGGLIAVVPSQFAQATAAELGLATYRPPIAIPTPEIVMYWHHRHDADAAHGWLRAQVIAETARFA